MTRKTSPVRSDIAWSTPDRIVIRGKSLPDEILGRMDIGAFSWLQMRGELPTPEQARMFNALIITLCEHGITPSALVARLTLAGAPESLQSAVAAGLCGLGTVFVGTTEGAARLLHESLAAGDAGADLPALARQVAERYRDEKRVIPGIGHPFHKPIDPRTPRLFEIARETGYHGRYCTLMGEISQAAEALSGKSLPVNATGAIGAICCELGIPWKIVRGLGVMARAIGLVGHCLEEMQAPMAMEVWRRTDDEASAHLKRG